MCIFIWMKLMPYSIMIKTYHQILQFYCKFSVCAWNIWNNIKEEGGFIATFARMEFQQELKDIADY